MEKPSRRDIIEQLLNDSPPAAAELQRIAGDREIVLNIRIDSVANLTIVNGSQLKEPA